VALSTERSEVETRRALTILVLRILRHICYAHAPHVAERARVAKARATLQLVQLSQRGQNLLVHRTRSTRRADIAAIWRDLP
jgi:hypothetical protein